MNAQQRLGRLIIALVTLAGLAGFIANQIIFFQTHPTQAPEVYTLNALILVIVVLLGLLGGVLMTHDTQVVRRLPTPARRIRSSVEPDTSSAPAAAPSAASELRHTSVAPMLALTSSVVILTLAVILAVVMLMTHPVGSQAPSGPASPGEGHHVPPGMSTSAPMRTPSPPPQTSPTSAPSPASTAGPAPTASPPAPQASPSPGPGGSAPHTPPSVPASRP